MFQHAVGMHLALFGVAGIYLCCEVGYMVVDVVFYAYIHVAYTS